ncbi:MAG: FAD:protein FMN transferase, partial [Candidatus Binatia bacterium]
MRALWAVLVVLGAVPVATATTQVHYVMGTYLAVTVDDGAPASMLAECFAEARALDRLFSRYDEASELTRLNAEGGGTASPE